MLIAPNREAIQLQFQNVREDICQRVRYSSTLVPRSSVLSRRGAIVMHPTDNSTMRRVQGDDCHEAKLVWSGVTFRVLAFGIVTLVTLNGTFRAPVRPVYPAFDTPYDRLVPRRAACS